MNNEQDERLKVLVQTYCWTPECSYPHCDCDSIPPHMREALASLDAHDAKRAREGVTEEIVKNAVETFNDSRGDRLSSMRAALEAAAPMLARGSAAPTPAAYPAAVTEEMKKAAIKAFWRNEGGLDQSIGPMLAAALAVAPKPQCAPAPAETASHPLLAMEGMKTAALKEHWRDEGAVAPLLAHESAALAVAHPDVVTDEMMTAASYRWDHPRSMGLAVRLHDAIAAALAAAPKPEDAPVADHAALERALAEAARAVSRNCGLPGDLRALAAAIEKRFGGVS